MTQPVEAVADVLDRLARLEPGSLPVISLYLDLRPDQHGKDNYSPFIRKELPARAGTYPLHSPERESIERDTERIEAYLADRVAPSANGLAIFACAGRDG